MTVHTHESMAGHGPDHGHDHGHGHDHPHGHENPHAGQGTVLLDIGGDVGALVVTMPRSMVGVEVDIVPSGTWPSGPVPHVAVVDRPVVSGSVPSLVYPDLQEGTYDLALKGTRDVVMTTVVRGGEVTTVGWPV